LVEHQTIRLEPKENTELRVLNLICIAGLKGWETVHDFVNIFYVTLLIKSDILCVV